MILGFEEVHWRMSLAVDRNSVDFLEHDAQDRLLENEKDDRPRYWRPARWRLIPVFLHLAILTIQVCLFVWPNFTKNNLPCE